ncbi:hypothetical protein ACIPSE_31945 [Streptomyces sp. NPDC090106]|uniref:hypothetical protein n=1 Tax=Streptomyces sp. NPDC090106 TaxID=3365946 RepID=UPI0038057F0B
MHRTPRPGLTAAALALALVTACAPDSAPTAHTGSSPRAPADTRARLTTALPADPVRMVLPATGAESRWTQGLDVFVRQVGQAEAVSCARERGASLPVSAPAAFIRFGEVPDLDFIARHGTSESATVPTPTANPTGTRPATAAEIRTCLAQGAATTDALRDRYAEVQGAWFGTIASLRRDPATLRAGRSLPDCFARHGVQAHDEPSYFALADRLMRNPDASELSSREHTLGQVYAACMRPVEAVRDPARAQLRTRFLIDPEHADAVETVRTTLVRALRAAEKRYGIPLVFPAP